MIRVPLVAPFFFIFLVSLAVSGYFPAPPTFLFFLQSDVLIVDILPHIAIFLPADVASAARPTFNPAKGNAHQGGNRLHAPTMQTSAKDQPGHTGIEAKKAWSGRPF